IGSPDTIATWATRRTVPGRAEIAGEASAWRRNMINPATPSWRRHTRACLLFAAAIFGPAAAENAGVQKQVRLPKPAEIAPRGQREAKDITYGEWRKLCVKPGGAPMLCRTSITGK